MIGIEKEIDDLGRIVIPKAYRDCLGLEQGDKVTLLLSDLNIVISASKSFCALCFKKIENNGTRLCSDCIRKIKSDEFLH